MVQAQATDNYPSLAWVLVPVLLVPLAYWVRSRLAARKLARTGIGRGAPGFQTNVSRIAVTPEIAARLRRGEQVSQEEISAAVQAATAAAGSSGGGGSPAVQEDVAPPGAEEDNEWLPEELKRRPGKRDLKAKKGKKRR